MIAYKKPVQYMLSRDGSEKGIIKNMYSRPCRMEGCTGTRIHVIWPDGKHTYPCSKGCRCIDENTMQIE